MPVLLAGLLLGVLFFVMLGRYGRGQLRQFVEGWRWPLGLMLSLATIALGMTGRADLAFLTGCGASYLMFGTVPFIWQTRTARPETGPTNRSASMPPQPAAMSKREALNVLG